MIQRYRAAIGGDQTVWPIVTPDEKGQLVYFADHERTVAELCEALSWYRNAHSKCFEHPTHDTCNGFDERCDLCKRTDALLAEQETQRRKENDAENPIR